MPSPMSQALLPGNDEDVKWLGSLLRQILEWELVGCSLLLALDPLYLTSHVISSLITLPSPKQVGFTTCHVTTAHCHICHGY